MTMSLIEDDILPDFLRLRWTSFLFTGVVLILAGLFCMGSPLTSGLALTVLIGISLLISGLFVAIQGLGSRSWSWFLCSVGLGVLLMLSGAFLLVDPLRGVEFLTVILGVSLVVSGVMEALASFWVRPLPMWRWQLLSGLLSIACGVFVYTRTGVSATILIGFAAGIGILTTGITFLRLGLAGRRAARQHIA